MLIASLIGFVGGAIAGSAATALADRFDQPRSFVVGRSRCPHCRVTLRWFELVPIASWLLQRGRCRHCQWPIGREVLAVELTTATVGAFAAGTVIGHFESPSWFGVSNLVFFVSLWCSLIGLGALALVDLETQLLPDRLILGTLPFLILVGIISPTVSLTVRGAILGGVVAGGSLFLIWWLSKGRGIGLGDVKLAGAFGLGLGWPLALLALWWASILGGLVAASLLVTRRVKFGTGTRVAFGPFLILGYVLALLAGRPLLVWFGLV